MVRMGIIEVETTINVRINIGVETAIRIEVINIKDLQTDNM